MTRHQSIRGSLGETDRSGLVAGYVGQTALKTADFGSEAVDRLAKAMEDDLGRRTQRTRFQSAVAGVASGDADTAPGRP